MCKGSKWAPGCGECQVNLMRLDPADGRKIWQRYIIGRDQPSGTTRGGSLRTFPNSDDIVMGYNWSPSDTSPGARVIERISENGVRLWQGVRPLTASPTLKYGFCVTAEGHVVYHDATGFHKVDGDGAPIWSVAPTLNTFAVYQSTTLLASGSDTIFGASLAAGNSTGTGWGKLDSSGGLTFQNVGGQSIPPTTLLNGSPDALLSNGDWLTIRDSSFTLMQLGGSDGEPVSWVSAAEVTSARRAIAAKDGLIYMLTGGGVGGPALTLRCRSESNLSTNIWSATVWSGTRIGQGVAVGSDGVYVVGQAVQGGATVHVAKLSLVDGSLIWTTRMGSSGETSVSAGGFGCTDVCVSPSGYVYVTGPRMVR